MTYRQDFEHRTRVAPPTDRAIKSTLVHRLREDPYTSGARIKVDVRHRVAMLDGEVSSDMAKSMASEEAHTIPGVVEVHNRLEVVPAA